MFCASLSVAKQMSIKIGENLLMAVQTFPGKTHIEWPVINILFPVKSFL